MWVQVRVLTFITLITYYYSTLLPATTSPHPLPPLKPRTQTTYKEHRLANTPDKGDANRWRGRVGSAGNNYTDVTVDDKHRWSDESSPPPHSHPPPLLPTAVEGVGWGAVTCRNVTRYLCWALPLVSLFLFVEGTFCGRGGKRKTHSQKGKSRDREDEWMECWVGKDVDKSGRKQRLIERRK